MEILGYIGALIIGIVMGLLGGGGSILAVPIFVYLLGINPVLATAYSLFVVGSTAVIGAARNLQKGNIDVKTGIAFAIPSLIAVYLTRKYIVPAIPNELFSIGDFLVTKEIGLMVFFAIIMLLAAISMLTAKEYKNDGIPAQLNFFKITLEGTIVGLLTGIVGAGGGFLIIPVLVLMAKLPMKKAVGTSLMIISLKSLIGFLGDVQNLEIDWFFLLSFTSLSIIGIIIGIYLAKFIPNKTLKKAFGFFVLIMGIYIFIKEIFL